MLKATVSLSSANSVASYDSFEAGPRVDRGALTPFAFTLDRLRVKFETQAKGSQFGAPRQFDADLTVRDEPGATPRQVTVSPNNPLDSGGRQDLRDRVVDAVHQRDPLAVRR